MTPNFTLAFLTLLLAHLLGDFVFQTKAQVEGKKARSGRAYLHHGALHLVLLVILTAFFLTPTILRPLTSLVLVTLVLAHLLIDWLKEAVLDERLGEALPFFTDQALHALTLVAAAIPIGSAKFAEVWMSPRRAILESPEAVLAIAVVYLATVFGGGYLIRVVLSRIHLGPGTDATPAEPAPATADPAASSAIPQDRLGMYIGWLERTIILTALLVGSPTLVGFVITAKAVIRFGESQNQFAEYFLFGTFLSLILAGAGGLLLRAWVLGDFGFVD